MQRQRNSQNKPYIRKIEFVFYNEAEIRAAVFEERNEPAFVPIIRNASGLSDPTAREAIYNLTPLPTVKVKGTELALPERWLLVIDKTYAWAKRQSEVNYEVARRRYNGEDYRKTCRELNISQQYQSKILENIKNYAALQAAQMNLIYIE